MSGLKFCVNYQPNFLTGFDSLFDHIFTSDNGDTLPTDGLLMLYDVASGVDSVGLSVADYTSVDSTVRDIFFVDSSTLRPTADAYALAISSPLLNTGTMVGSAAKVVALYITGTDQAILSEAYAYFGQPRTVYFLSPSGSDSNTGLTTSDAWLNISKLNTESGSWIEPTRVLIDTSSSALDMDAELLVRDGMVVTGVGTQTIINKDKDDVDYTVSVDAAELRPYKAVGTFYQPDSVTYPNVWRTDDAEVTAVLFRFDGWIGNDQPLIWLDHIAGSTSPQATINTTVDSFWCGESYIDFYSATNPNSDGTAWVRTQPEQILTAIHVMGGGSLDNFVVGGVTAVPEESQSVLAGYAVRSYGADSKTTSVSRVYGFCGSNHIIGHTPDDVCSNGVVDWSGIRFDQHAPWSNNGTSGIPFVLYGNGGTGNTVSFSDLYCGSTTGVVGLTDGLINEAMSSFYCHNRGDGAIEYATVVFNNCNLASRFTMGDSMVSELSVYDTQVSRATTKGNSNWGRSLFTIALPSVSAGAVTEITYSRLVTTAPIHTLTQGQVQGNYSLMNCNLDGREHTGSSFTNCRFLNRVGALNLVFKNNVMTMGGYPFTTSAKDNSLITLVSKTEDTVSMSNNMFCNSKNVSDDAIVKFDDATEWTFSDLQTEGQADGSMYYYNDDPAVLIGPTVSIDTMEPDAGSPLINAGVVVDIDALDYAGNPLVGNPDIGAYEYHG